MKKFSFLEKLNGLILYQDFRQNPDQWPNIKFTKTSGASGNVAGHIGVDISRGDGDPLFAYWNGEIVYIQPDTVVYLTEPDENGLCLEVNMAHMKNVVVSVGQKIKRGDKLGEQDSTGPSSMWASEVDKTSWSHEHLGIREAKRGPKVEKDYIWNFQKFSPVEYNVVEYDPSVEHFRNPNDYSAQIAGLIAEKGIKRMEGYFAPGENPRYPNGTPAWKHKNPGNFRATGGVLTSYMRSLGATGVDNGWVVFPSYEIGLSALSQFLKDAAAGKLGSYRPDMPLFNPAYKKVGDKNPGFFQIYAPSDDGNYPAIYAQNVVSWCGLRSVEQPISDWLLTEIEYLKKYSYIPFVGFNGMSRNPETVKVVWSFKALWNLLFKGR